MYPMGRGTNRTHRSHARYPPLLSHSYNPWQIEPMGDYLPSGSLMSIMNNRIRSENCSEMARAPAFFVHDKNV